MDLWSKVSVCKRGVNTSAKNITPERLSSRFSYENQWFSHLLELATATTGATGAAEVVSRTLARTPPATHAGCRDDGSHTNPLK